jgi:phenylpropionate dioxygenase-like ring-hydroxylating dioxygenase large terminal subunit
MFLRNYWYVAAFSHEVGREPLARTLLGEPVVLFRLEDGRVAALQDRCAHRLMPLSKGRVVNDTLQCCYHGLTYDSSGACVHIPRQEAPPAGFSIRSYPAAERYGAVWLWMGESRLADPSRIFECSLLDPSGSDGMRIYFHVKANYMFINDNLADLLHIGFLHNPAVNTASPVPSSSAIGNDYLQHGTIDVQAEGDRIAADWTWQDIEPPPTFKAMAGIRGLADGWVLSTFQPPSFFVNPIGFADAGTGGMQSPRKEGAGKFSFTLYQCITPETERTTHFFKIAAQSWTPEMREKAAHMINKVNAEDIWAMELQQQSLDRNPGAQMRFIQTDGGVLRMRRVLDRLFQEEAAAVSAGRG